MLLKVIFVCVYIILNCSSCGTKSEESWPEKPCPEFVGPLHRCVSNLGCATTFRDSNARPPVCGPEGEGHCCPVIHKHSAPSCGVRRPQMISHHRSYRSLTHENMPKNKLVSSSKSTPEFLPDGHIETTNHINGQIKEKIPGNYKHMNSNIKNVLRNGSHRQRYPRNSGVIITREDKKNLTNDFRTMNIPNSITSSHISNHFKSSENNIPTYNKSYFEHIFTHFKSTVTTDSFSTDGDFAFDRKSDDLYLKNRLTASTRDYNNGNHSLNEKSEEFYTFVVRPRMLEESLFVPSFHITSYENQSFNSEENVYRKHQSDKHKKVESHISSPRPFKKDEKNDEMHDTGTNKKIGHLSKIDREGAEQKYAKINLKQFSDQQESHNQISSITNKSRIVRHNDNASFIVLDKSLNPKPANNFDDSSLPENLSQAKFKHEIKAEGQKDSESIQIPLHTIDDNNFSKLYNQLQKDLQTEYLNSSLPPLYASSISDKKDYNETKHKKTLSIKKSTNSFNLKNNGRTTIPITDYYLETGVKNYPGGFTESHTTESQQVKTASNKTSMKQSRYYPKEEIIGELSLDSILPMSYQSTIEINTFFNKGLLVKSVKNSTAEEDEMPYSISKISSTVKIPKKTQLQHFHHHKYFHGDKDVSKLLANNNVQHNTNTTIKEKSKHYSTDESIKLSVLENHPSLVTTGLTNFFGNLHNSLFPDFIKSNEMKNYTTKLPSKNYHFEDKTLNELALRAFTPMLSERVTTEEIAITSEKNRNISNESSSTIANGKPIKLKELHRRKKYFDDFHSSTISSNKKYTYENHLYSINEDTELDTANNNLHLIVTEKRIPVREVNTISPIKNMESVATQDIPITPATVNLNHKHSNRYVDNSVAYDSNENLTFTMINASFIDKNPSKATKNYFNNKVSDYITDKNDSRITSFKPTKLRHSLNRKKHIHNTSVISKHQENKHKHQHYFTKRNNELKEFDRSFLKLQISDTVGTMLEPQNDLNKHVKIDFHKTTKPSFPETTTKYSSMLGKIRINEDYKNYSSILLFNENVLDVITSYDNSMSDTPIKINPKKQKRSVPSESYETLTTSLTSISIPKNKTSIKKSGSRKSKRKRISRLLKTDKVSFDSHILPTLTHFSVDPFKITHFRMKTPIDKLDTDLKLTTKSFQNMTMIIKNDTELTAKPVSTNEKSDTTTANSVFDLSKIAFTSKNSFDISKNPFSESATAHISTNEKSDTTKNIFDSPKMTLAQKNTFAYSEISVLPKELTTANESASDTSNINPHIISNSSKITLNSESSCDISDISSTCVSPVILLQTTKGSVVDINSKVITETESPNTLEISTNFIQQNMSITLEENDGSSFVADNGETQALFESQSLRTISPSFMEQNKSVDIKETDEIQIEEKTILMAIYINQHQKEYITKVSEDDFPSKITADDLNLNMHKTYRNRLFSKGKYMILHLDDKAQVYKPEEFATNEINPEFKRNTDAMSFSPTLAIKHHTKRENSANVGSFTVLENATESPQLLKSHYLAHEEEHYEKPLHFRSRNKNDHEYPDSKMPKIENNAYFENPDRDYVQHIQSNYDKEYEYNVEDNGDQKLHYSNEDGKQLKLTLNSKFPQRPWNEYNYRYRNQALQDGIVYNKKYTDREQKSVANDYKYKGNPRDVEELVFGDKRVINRDLSIPRQEFSNNYRRDYTTDDRFYHRVLPEFSSVIENDHRKRPTSRFLAESSIYDEYEEDSEEDTPIRKTNPQYTIGGKLEDEPWPWMVAIYSYPTMSFVCAGTLIDFQHVLSAAHCFYKVNPKNLYTVVIGKLDKVKKYSLRNTGYQVEKVYVHKGFVPDCYCNDIALLRLKKVLEADQLPICLPAIDAAGPGENATVLGWGDTSYTDKDTSTKRLQRLDDVILYPNDECRSIISNIAGKTLDERFSDYYICAGVPDGSKDACVGDSGGPLMHEDYDGLWSLIGVVSFGYKCGNPGTPGAYSRVSYYMPWIMHHIENKPSKTDDV